MFQTGLFHRLLQRVVPEIPKELVRQQWNIINNAYDHDHQRHYHTMAHIGAMWGVYTLWKEYLPPLTEYDEVVLFCAILFHDVVYDPRAKSGQNERNSVVQWEVCASRFQLPERLTAEVTALILATIHHALPKENEEHPTCLAIFLDLDLEVLARPREEYAAYASQIRAEYAHVPPDAFRDGRCAVLRSLARGDIYFTEHCRTHLRDAAKANMEWEIGELTQKR